VRGHGLWTRRLCSVEGIGSEPNQQAGSGEDGAQAGGAHLWGMQLLLAPLVKRFRYHFMSKRPTNNIEKVPRACPASLSLSLSLVCDLANKLS
jgi:hypothetical protein